MLDRDSSYFGSQDWRPQATDLGNSSVVPDLDARQPMGVGAGFDAAQDRAEGYQQAYPEPDLTEPAQPRRHVDKYAHLAPRDHEPGVARVVDQGYDEVTIRRDGTDYVHPVLIGDGRNAISPHPIDEVRSSSPWRQTYDGGADLDADSGPAYMNSGYDRGGLDVIDRDQTGWRDSGTTLRQGSDIDVGHAAITGAVSEAQAEDVTVESLDKAVDGASDLAEAVELADGSEHDDGSKEPVEDPRLAILKTNPTELRKVVDGFRSAADEMLRTFTEGGIAKGMEDLRRYPEILGADDPSYVVTEVAAGDHRSEKPDPEDSSEAANEQKEPDTAPETPRVDPQWTSEAAWRRDTLMDGTVECGAIEHAHRSVRLAGEIATTLGRLKAMMGELGDELSATWFYREPFLHGHNLPDQPRAGEDPRTDVA